MAAAPSDSQHPNILRGANGYAICEDRGRDLGLYKRPDHFRAVDVALEIAVERSKADEALQARDAAIQRLLGAYESIRQKSLVIEQLQQGLVTSGDTDNRVSDESENARMKGEISRLEQLVKNLQGEVKATRDAKAQFSQLPEPSPHSEDTSKNTITPRPTITYDTREIQTETSFHSVGNSTTLPGFNGKASDQYRDSAKAASNVTTTLRIVNEIPYSSNKSDELADMIKSREAILVKLPLPEEVPDGMLSPMSIPQPLTLQEFLSNLSGSLRTSLANYRLFYSNTTHWCPEREEHGYFYTPLFKCSTNPRVTTAHRWNSVEVIGRMSKPTECFFNKEGLWYYAGVYKAFRLDDLTTKEWAALSHETAQAIVKETISGRKNISPQNVYETNQLYAVGALKVACVGVQCVGFNNAMYKALLEQAFILSKIKMTNSSANLSPTPLNLSSTSPPSPTFTSSPQPPGLNPSWPPPMATPGSGASEVTENFAKLNLGHKHADSDGPGILNDGERTERRI